MIRPMLLAVLSEPARPPLTELERLVLEAGYAYP